MFVPGLAKHSRAGRRGNGMELRRKNSMRKGKSATRPSASRDELNGRMVRMEEVGTLMTWPNGLPRGSGRQPVILVKASQAWSNRFSLGSSGLEFDCPCHILWVPFHNAQRMVVGLCGNIKTGRQIAIAPIVPGQTQSNPVKLGQSERRGLTVKPQRACRLLQMSRKYRTNCRCN
jgi:hypothetical protein